MGIVDSHSGILLPIDDITGGRIEIDAVHHEIHEGNHYSVSYSKSLSAGSVLAIAITAPATTLGYMHFVPQVDSNLSGQWYFTSGASVSAGSSLTIFNNDLNSINTSGTAIVGTPTVTTYGTVIETHLMGSNTNPQRTGSSTASRNEFILTPSSVYTVYFQADATSTRSSITATYYMES